MDNIEIKSTASSLFGSVLSMVFGWIPVSVASETVQVAIISLIIGWIGGKILSRIDAYFTAKFKKKKSKIKEPEA